MGFLTRQFRSSERRAISFQDAFTQGLSFGGRSASPAARTVNVDSAERLSAVHACVSLISDDCSHLPLEIIQVKGDERKHLASPAWLDSPNDEMTRFEFFEAQNMSLLMRGNFYASVITDNMGKILELWPLDPDSVEPERGPDRKIRYRIRLEDGNEAVQPRYRYGGGPGILHIPWYKRAGDLKGRDPIQRARESIALGLVIEEFGTNWFQNGSNPSGVIELDKPADKPTVDRLRGGWDTAHGGSRKANGVAVLSDGAKWKPISVSPENAQFLGSRSFQTVEIARWYRVPPHLIADVERSTSWGSGLEEQNIGYAMHTLTPFLARPEQHYSNLLPRGQQAKFNLAGLMRGNISGRYEAYSKGRDGGWLSRNDIRRLEDMNPIDGGDDYLTPLNHTALGETDNDD